MDIPLTWGLGSSGKLRKKCWMISHTTRMISKLCWQGHVLWRMTFSLFQLNVYIFLWVFRFLCVASLGSNYRWTAARILQFRFQLPIEALNAGECNSLAFNFFIPCPKLIKQKDKIPTMTARTWACVCLWCRVLQLLTPYASFNYVNWQRVVLPEGGWECC